MTQDQIQHNFKVAYSEIINRDRFDDWENIISEVLELEHQDILKQIEADDFSNINWSSGQHILISTMTELVCNIERESLILFDEPEIHLHPNAIANVMRMFSKLLEKYDSYAIFATHSPIILQELPSTNIQIFEKIDNTISVRNPLVECFGDNISHIISDIFDVTEIESYHKQVLKRLSEEISEMMLINQVK
ncbi:MAG: AAA family ATPase [Lachnospiraceae bacterium]